MTECNHSQIVLLPEKKTLLRCRHCHLTIKPEDLGEKCCPECFQEQGAKRYDFEEVAPIEKETARYRCEKCGIIIESD